MLASVPKTSIPKTAKQQGSRVGGQKTTLVCMPFLLILWSSQFVLLFTFSQTSRMVMEHGHASVRGFLHF
jgi:hypothetical protein